MSGALAQVLSSPGTWLLAFTYFFIYVVGGKGLGPGNSWADWLAGRRKQPQEAELLLAQQRGCQAASCNLLHGMRAAP
jgi:hypothetical protein